MSLPRSTTTFISRALLVLASLLPTAAMAHARLERCEPTAGATLAQPPTVLRLHFNEPVEAAMSRVTLSGALGNSIELGPPALAPADAKVLVVPLRAPALKAGAYRIHWSTMGHDGHHTKGDVSFSVK